MTQITFWLDFSTPQLNCVKILKYFSPLASRHHRSWTGSGIFTFKILEALLCSILGGL